MLDEFFILRPDSQRVRVGNGFLINYTNCDYQIKSDRSGVLEQQANPNPIYDLAKNNKNERRPFIVIAQQVTVVIIDHPSALTYR
jgi:hypothetical protein